MEAQFLRCLGEVGTSADRILERKLGGALKFASAFYPSGFDAAAILVIDDIGEAACSTLLRGEGAQIAFRLACGTPSPDTDSMSSVA